jgi:hypothetical protein
MVDERLLQRVQRAVVGKTLDRGHLTPVVLHGKGETGEDPLPVDEHCARTARALVASLFRAVEPQLLADEVKQRDPRVGGHRHLAAVDDDRHDRFPFGDGLTRERD